MPAPSAAAPTPPAWRDPLLGALAALPFAALLFHLPEIAVDLLSVLLALMGGILVGRGRPSWASPETLAGVVFVFLGVQGLWWSGAWLAGGYLIHAAAEAFFTRRRAEGPDRRWRPSFALLFDVVIAASVLLLF